MPTLENNHGERIASLEAGQKALQESVTKLANIVREQAETQADEHSATRKEISMLGDKLNQIGRPNYAVVVAGIGVLLAAGAALFWPIQMQLGYQREADERLSQAIQAHVNLPIHPVADAVLKEREQAQERENALREKIENLKFSQVYQAMQAQRELLETKIKAIHGHSQF